MSTVQTTVRGISSTPAINYHVDRHFNILISWKEPTAK